MAGTPAREAAARDRVDLEEARVARCVARVAAAHAKCAEAARRAAALQAAAKAALAAQDVAAFRAAVDAHVGTVSAVLDSHEECVRASYDRARAEANLATVHSHLILVVSYAVAKLNVANTSVFCVCRNSFRSGAPDRASPTLEQLPGVSELDIANL